MAKNVIFSLIKLLTLEEARVRDQIYCFTKMRVIFRHKYKATVKFIKELLKTYFKVVEYVF